jgi:CubicO group peptidase (beta-lactamase class C family)
MSRTSTRTTAVLGGLAALALAASACSPGWPSPGGSGGSGGSGRPGGPTYPGADWAHGDAAAAGFDTAKLEELAAEAEANGSNCLVVVRHGRIVYDRYWNGTDATTMQDVFSTTKSLVSTLVGIAQADGDLDIDDPMSDYVPEWSGTPSAGVTIEDILSNASGRHWDLTSDYQDLLTAPDRTRFAVGLGQDAEPGQVWVYNNAAIQTLDAVLEAATGTDPAAYSRQRVFEPLGMRQSEMTQDPAGNTNMFFGWRSTCEDMARFGHLFLRQGRWGHEQIVPGRWVRAATGRPSQALNAAYGYLWWLNRRGPVVNDTLQSITAEEAAHAPARQYVDGAPQRLYWAWGLGGQVVQVDPATDTVVVRLAGLQ